MRKSLLTLSLLAASAAPAFAADYTDGDLHKNDYKWLQFNLMGVFDEKPGNSSHDYLEMEFGGRSGIFDLYGYIDIFNLLSDPGSDKSDADAKMFMKFNPRVSIDGMIKKDLSFGPLQELYIASEITWDGVTTNADKGTFGVNQQKIGIGSDIVLPWIGKMGLNLYGTYDSNVKDWNGMQISTNWFKPFVNFDNGTFIAYQGYIDYQFGMKEEYSGASNGGAMFNGIYWHSQRFALGYGLKLYKDVYGIEDGAPGFDGNENISSGASHYISATYKF